MDRAKGFGARLVGLMLREEKNLLSRSPTVKVVGGSGSVVQLVTSLQAGVPRYTLRSCEELVSRFREKF